jgi:hypothetical protein
MTFVFFHPMGEKTSLDGVNWRRVNPGFCVARYLQYAMDVAVHGREWETPPPLPDGWENEYRRRFLINLWGAVVPLLPTQYFSMALRNRTARQNLSHAEENGLFAWDDAGNENQFDLLPGIKEGVSGLELSLNKRKHKLGVLDGLMDVWSGVIIDGEGMGAVPAYDKDKGIGWAVCCHHPVQIAVAEIFFLTTYNIRRLKLCPACAKFHWEKDHVVCRGCRNARERKRRSVKGKTPEERFLNKVYQQLTRMKIKEKDQREKFLGKIRDSLEQEGLEAAEVVYGKLLLNRKGRN